MNESTRAERLSLVFDGVARLILIGLCAFLPLFFIPTAWAALPQSKMIFVVLAVAVALIVWIIARAAEGALHIPRSALLYVAALLPLAYFASAAGSNWSATSVVGSGIEQDTLTAMIVWFSMFALAAVLFSKNAASIRLAVQALIGGITAVTLFQILHIVSPSVFTMPGMAADATSNLLGSWHDLGIISALGVYMSVALWQSDIFGRASKIVFPIVGIISFTSLALIHFSDTFWGLAAMSGISLLVALFISYKNGTSFGSGAIRTLPWALLVAISIVFGLYGTQIAEKYPENLRITQVEVRPSWQGTLDVAKQSLGAPSSVIFGSGPNSFIRTWGQFKPVAVNMTPFWDTDFNFGVGIIPTSIFTAGLFGFLAWAAIAITLAGVMFRYGRTVLAQSQTLPVFGIFLIAVLYLIAFHVMYTPGHVITGITFISLGILAALSSSGAPIRTVRIGVRNVSEMIILLALIVLVGAILLSSGLIGREVVSNLLVNKGSVVYAETQDAGKAGAAVSRALSISPNNDRAHRAAAELGLVELARLAAEAGTNQEAVAALQNTLQTTIQHGLTAVSINDSNYQNWLSLATIYSNLAGANVEGSLEAAIKAYESASKANPTNPAPKIRLAQLAIAKNDAPTAKKYLDEAIALKSDIAIAHYLKSQILAAEGNAEGAVQSAADTVKIVPEEPVAWFNLGYILYASGNFRDAAGVLEKAVTLRAEYANAIFVLGLTYYELGLKDNAIGAFARVGELNPNETWLLQVIQNIQTGKELFAGVQQQGVASAPPPAAATR